MKILMIEGDQALAAAAKAQLKAKGFDVDVVSDGKSGAEHARLGIFDLLIMDGTIPALGGCSAIKDVRRRRSSVPIIILTEAADTQGRIAWLNAGADYCIQKPVDPKELLACINAVLRRQGHQKEELVYGNTKLDMASCLLTCGENSVRLSAREVDVMRFLLQSKNSVLSKEVILACVWGLDSSAVDNHVEVYVGFLRKKLAAIGSNIRIIAMRRLGYQLTVQETIE